MFRPFWDESSLGFFDQEIILIFHFTTSLFFAWMYCVLHPRRPRIYSSSFESGNSVFWNTSCLKHRSFAHVQHVQPRLFRYSRENRLSKEFKKCATHTSERLEGQSSDSSNTEGSMVDKGSYLISRPTDKISSLGCIPVPLLELRHCRW